MEHGIVWENFQLSFCRLLRHIFLFFSSLFISTFDTGSQQKYPTVSDIPATINEQAERMLNIYGNSILQMAYSYLHNMVDAEEVLQDTLIQFLKTSPDLETKEHEKAWLLRVAANLSKNRIKYNAIRKTDELMEELVSEEREDLSFVWEAVKMLPEKYREVIHLFYHEGYQTGQISQILGIKESTVCSHLARGREKLKTVLKEAYDFE